jgi:hypothetical protein
MKNQIPEGHFYTMGDVKYKITVANEDGKVLYDFDSYAGILCTVERIEVDRERGETHGQQQVLVWGDPITILHADVQLRQKMKEVFAERTMREYIEKFMNI